VPLWPAENDSQCMNVVPDDLMDRDERKLSLFYRATMPRTRPKSEFTKPPRRLRRVVVTAPTVT
jgi:hypothetical protein